MTPETSNLMKMFKMPAKIQRGIRLIEKETGDSLFMALCEGEDVDEFIANLKDEKDFSQLIFNEPGRYPTLKNILYNKDMEEKVDHYQHGFYSGSQDEDVQRYFSMLWETEINRSWCAYMAEDTAHAAATEESIENMLSEPES